MRVCHIYPTVLLNDGPSNVLYALLRELQRKSVENVVISLRHPPDARSPRQMIESTGARYVELGMSDAFLDLTVLPMLIRTIREAQPDLVQCNLIRANLYGRLAARVAGKIPVICIAHNVERYMTENGIGNWMVRRMELWTKGLVSANVAVSQAVAGAQAKVLGAPEESITVIYNGLGDLPPGLPGSGVRNRLGIPAEAFACGSIGRLHPQKNFSCLLQAAAEAARHMDDLQIVILGDGIERSKLETLSKKLGLERRVHMLGHRTDVEELVAAFDVFLLTSDYEGMPIALLEAMRAGLPIIVTNAGGMPEAIKDGVNGFVEEIGDYAAIAMSIKRLRNDLELRKRIGEAARASYIEQFSTLRMACDYLSLYRRAMKATC